VLNFVLNKLEARQANRVKRKMIGSARVGYRKRGGAHFAERCQPLTKDWPDRFVILQIDAADLAGAVIEIEVGTEFFIVRFRYQHARRRAGRRRRCRGWTTGSTGRRSFQFAKVFGHVSLRSQQSLLFSGPQSYSDGAA